MAPLGRSAPSVTPLAFGGSALGGMPDTYGHDVSEAQARDTLEAIFESPVNHLDTSNNYGMGRSEQRIGDAIRARGGLPEGFVLATKLDRDMDAGRFDADRVRRSLEESLTRLGLDRVQILHFHDPEHARDMDEITKTGGAIEELFKLKDEGLCDATGIAMGRTDILAPLVRDFPFDIVLNHNRYTLLNRASEPVFEAAQAKGMTIYNAAPYAGGVLAKGAGYGRITYQEVTDDTQLNPVREIERLCAEHGVAPGALALQFSLRASLIASTIIGVSKPERVAQTLEWAEADIPDALWKAVEALPVDRADPEANRVYKPG
ncbi:MAG: aldo/keto reductase [Pseudomonadota bacterium]